ncbi:class I SAM-dependent methyltransferase [Brevibacillus ginsengisoli]|uniref:class I SAM-dependent methyltransferase n=1 Tax=Brevibacillus ginsengisoli TaxID=363854 RepID=UPI003CF61793
MSEQEIIWNAGVAWQWNRNAANWHSRSKEMWENGSRRTILPMLRQLVQPQAGSVLDAGCGDGYGSWKLAADGYSVTGVDLSDEMIMLAKKRMSPDLNLMFHSHDITALPFEDTSFAAILAVNVIEWTESPLVTLQEFSRLLQPGGVLLLGVLGPTAAPRAYSYRRLYHEAIIQNTMMPWEACQLALENGFELLVEHPVYKEGVDPSIAETLTSELKQSLSFLTVFALRKV